MMAMIHKPLKQNLTAVLKGDSMLHGSAMHAGPIFAFFSLGQNGEI